MNYFSIPILWLFFIFSKENATETDLRRNIKRFSQINHQIRAQKIPVLCYHQIRDWKNTDSKVSRSFIMPIERFAGQIKMLHELGYQTVSPDQLVKALIEHRRQSAKTIMITFDDGSVSQFSNALAPLEQYGFKAVFFLMTVTLDRPGYLSSEQVRMITKQGHVIGCHTWDHHTVTQFTFKDWNKQLSKPTHILEQITSKPIRYFAYPYGIWDREAIKQLRAHQYEAAFQLNGLPDEVNPEFTIPRILVDGHWDNKTLLSMIYKHSD